MDNRIKELSKICVKWNRWKLDPNKAMVKIWNLFIKENLEEWNKEIDKEG